MKRKGLALTLIMALLFSAVAGTLGIENVGSADSVVDDWPMFHYDPVHSGSPDNIAPTAHDLLWSFNTIISGDPTSVISSSPAVVGGVVYIGSDDGHIYALNASSGSCVWSLAIGRFATTSPAVVSGVVYVSVWEGRDYALNAATGTVIWNCSRKYSHSSPAVSNGFYYVCSSGNVTALNASTGSLIWSYYIGSNGAGSPVVVEDTVYVSDFGIVYALDASSGTLKWSYFMRDGNTFNSPAVANGIVYAGCEGDVFYALDASTGTQIWNYSTGSYIRSSAAVASGVIYVGTGTETFTLSAHLNALHLLRQLQPLLQHPHLLQQPHLNQQQRQLQPLYLQHLLQNQAQRLHQNLPQKSQNFQFR